MPCTENVPPGVARPTLVERIPASAKAGELVELEIVVQHASGETATMAAELPTAFSGSQIRLVDEANWARGAAPQSRPDPADPSRSTTLIKLPLVPLPTSMQRSTLTVPPLRVIVLRKGGGDLSVCTASHPIQVDQPIASTPDPVVRPNPESVEQITRNERLQDIVGFGLLALILGAVVAIVVSWWLRRPKAPPAPKPAPPAWTVAMEAILAARSDLAMGQVPVKVYYDRLSDVLRVFLGEMYGFDGLESTTDETLARLRQTRSPALPFEEVVAVLTECDLVKFASQTRTAEEGMQQATHAEAIVRRIADARRGTPIDVRTAVGATER